MITIKHWYIKNDQLYGNVYGHHKFEDGYFIETTPIQNVENHDNFKIVKTKNTEYYIYPKDIRIEYNNEFPNAYDKLGK